LQINQYPSGVRIDSANAFSDHAVSRIARLCGNDFFFLYRDLDARRA
jgi:hypothetical protein